MARASRSLNISVPWNQLLNLLEIKIPARGLPTRMQCALCQTGILTVYDDLVAGGQWFHCQHCKKHGDMIELAAFLWELDIPKTVIRLARYGFDISNQQKIITRYEQQHVQYRQRMQTLWKNAQNGFIFQSPTTQKLLHRLGLRWQGSIEDWHTGPGCLIGGIDKVSVEHCFAPTVMKHAAEKRQNVNPSARAVFRGGDWGNVLLMPYYDLPERICAFRCVGRNADPREDFVLKCANYSFAGNQYGIPPVEGGLSVHPDVHSHAEIWDNTVFALDDPILAIRLQIRHLDHNIRPLPLAVWIDTGMSQVHGSSNRRARTQQAWNMLGDRKIVFWMPRFNLATLRQAIEVNGLISTVGPRDQGEGDQELKDYCWKYVPQELFRHIQNTARPWSEVFSKELSGMGDIAVEEFLFWLGEEGEDVESILRRCQRGVQQKVAEIRKTCDLPRRVIYNRQTILEKNDGWYVMRKRSDNPEIITDAILRIDAVVPHRRLDKIYYQGRVLFGGQEIPFCELQERITKDTLAWMRDLLIERGVGLILCNPAWTRGIITISELFHEPKLLEGVDTVGWDSGKLRFVFPQYAIHVGGEVKPLETAFMLEHAPGRRLNEPVELSGEELSRPAENEELAGLFWATTACVISNIVAPVFNQQPSGIALQGDGALCVGLTVAKSLGCNVEKLCNAKDVKRALIDEKVHRWPLVFDVAQSVQRRSMRKLLKGEGQNYRNCIMGSNWYTEQVLLLRTGWHMISSQRNMKVGDEIKNLADILIPSYLSDFCKRGLQLDDGQVSKETFVERILRDMMRFVDEHHGDAAAVLAAHNVLTPDRDVGNGKAFADLVAQYLNEKKLKIGPAPDGRGMPTLIEVPDKNSFFLSQKTLANLLRNQPVDPPTVDEVAVALESEGTLTEARADGWLIEADWIWKRYREIKRSLPEILQIHG